MNKKIKIRHGKHETLSDILIDNKVREKLSADENAFLNAFARRGYTTVSDGGMSVKHHFLVTKKELNNDAIVQAIKDQMKVDDLKVEKVVEKPVQQKTESQQKTKKPKKQKIEKTESEEE